MTECTKFRIEGRVQGVWFRESTRKQAVRLGITGYAVNKADGSVEVLACGDPADLEKLHDWLRQGPPLAQVHSVTPVDSDETAPPAFSTG